MKPRIGILESGPRDSIADIDGVTVGHATVARGDLQTGVTVIRPHRGDPFVDKVAAAAVIINGHGKATGLIQVNELGVIETPIALTNTFAIGTVANAQIRAAIAAHPGIARTTTTVNPLVLECSDAFLSDMQDLATVTEAHYLQALDDARPDFARGSVGGGRGVSCFGLKGGIGTASRRATAGSHDLTIGVLVQANFGRMENLTLAGRRIGPALQKRLAGVAPQRDKGSIIVVLATDAPLDHRQLRRIGVRAGAGIARMGSYYGHSSGDFAIAFAPTQTMSYDGPDIFAASALNEPLLEKLFDAAAEATEAAIVDAMFCAETVTGFQGHVRHAIMDVAPDWARLA
jgi:D-aminopeptidase